MFCFCIPKNSSLASISFFVVQLNLVLISLKTHNTANDSLVHNFPLSTWRNQLWTVQTPQPPPRVLKRQHRGLVNSTGRTNCKFTCKCVHSYGKVLISFHYFTAFNPIRVAGAVASAVLKLMLRRARFERVVVCWRWWVHEKHFRFSIVISSLESL